MRSRAAAVVVAALALVVGAAGCGRGTHRPAMPQSASPSHGRQLIEYYGCGACHVIGGIATANGHVGPPLTDFGSNHQIAGTLPNTPANVVRWIMNPQGILPKTDMPNLGIGRSGAQSIAAYLYGQ